MPVCSRVHVPQRDRPSPWPLRLRSCCYIGRTPRRVPRAPELRPNPRPMLGRWRRCGHSGRGLLLADDRSTRGQSLQPGRCEAARRPSVRAHLLGFRSVDAPQTIGDAALLERVAVGDCLRRCRCRPKEGHGADSTTNTSNDGHVLITPIQLAQCNVNHSTPFASIIDLLAGCLNHAKCRLSQSG